MSRNAKIRGLFEQFAYQVSKTSRSLLPDTEHNKRRFLEEYRQSLGITRAATSVGISRACVHLWQQNDSAFKAELDSIKEQGIEILEEEARRRAFKGTEKPVYQGGELVGHIREYSDVLLIFLLKGLKPDVYRDRSEVRISGDSNIKVTYEISPTLHLLREASDSEVPLQVVEGQVRELSTPEVESG